MECFCVNLRLFLFVDYTYLVHLYVPKNERRELHPSSTNSCYMYLFQSCIFFNPFPSGKHYLLFLIHSSMLLSIYGHRPYPYVIKRNTKKCISKEEPFLFLFHPLRTEKMNQYLNPLYLLHFPLLLSSLVIHNLRKQAQHP